MFLIFGVQGIKRKISDEPVLQNKCPSCGSGDLVPTSFRNWFTLFFIPIFPVSSGKLIYQCNQCKNSFAEEIRDHVKAPIFQTDIAKDDYLLIFARAYIASLTLLVIEGKRQQSKELYEIDKSIYKYPEFTQELESIKASIESQGNAENQVFEYLYEAKDNLSKSEVWKLFTFISSFLNQFGELTEKQVNLIKEFMIASGLPKSQFNEIF